MKISRCKIAIVTSMLVVATFQPAHSQTVIQFERAFHPSEVTITRGETLTISNHDEFIHQIYVNSGVMNFDSNEQPPGQDVLVNFPSAGTFEVRCHIHPRMRLFVHVK
jgi:plastocyanin